MVHAVREQFHVPPDNTEIKPREIDSVTQNGALFAVDCAEIAGETRDAIGSLEDTIRLVEADALPGIEMLSRAKAAGVSLIELAKMLGRFLVDSTIGNVPIVGDCIDFFWKPNRANVEAFKRVLESRQKMG